MDPSSGRNLAYALGTLALIVAIQRFFKGFMATVAVLVGLVAGTLVAWALGDAHVDSVSSSAWVGVTTPFYFGWPTFSFAAIVSMMVVMLITAVETTGDVFATGEIDRQLRADDGDDVREPQPAEVVVAQRAGVRQHLAQPCHPAPFRPVVRPRPAPGPPAILGTEPTTRPSRPQLAHRRRASSPIALQGHSRARAA